jgi:RNA polymerase sigma-70 factor, ECF subfamily
MATWFRAAAADPGAWHGAELDALLAAARDAARAAWPGVELADRAFAEHLARRAEDPAALAALRTSDLYLARACANGDAAAIAAFERAYFGEIDAAARRTRASAAQAAEVAQRLRHVLFVGTADRGPALADFAGRGDLRGWLRVAATRDFIALAQREQRAVPLDDERLLDAISPAADPELRYIGELYRAPMTAAVRAALDALPARERRLLRMSLLDGLSIDELGALHGVHRSTAARWLTAARDGILARTRAELGRLVGASPEDVESIVRLLHSRVEVSLERALQTRPPEG